MSLTEEIIEEIKKLDEDYIRNPNRMVQDYTQEARSIASYNGRQLYELLQNAEDAIEEGITEGSISKEENNGVLVSFRGGVLTVANSGKPFDRDGVVSLMYSGLSSKVNKRMIGKKGLGFRSILSWAKNVRLFSGDLALEFSRDYAISHYKDLCSKKPDIEQIISRRKDKSIDYPIATLACPKIIEQNNPLSGFSTCIIIEVKKSQELIRQINEQIDSLNEKDILFLKEINLLKIERDGYADVAFEKEFVDGKVNIYTVNGDKQETSTYILKTCEGEIPVTKENVTENEPYEIDLACSSDGDFTSNEFLYNYFKTNIKLPLGFIVNCPFELTENRNDLPLVNSTNELLMKKLAEVIVSFAEELSHTFKDPYRALLSCGIKGFNNMGQQFATLISEIKSLLANAKVLPQVTGNFVSSKDGVYFSGHDYTQCLNKNILENFLVNSDDNYVNNYILNELHISRMQLDEFSQILEAQINVMSKKEKAQCAYFIIKDYAKEINKSTELPHLLVDAGGKAITSGKVYVLEKKYNDLKMPSFAKFSILDSEQCDILKSVFDCSATETLVDKLSCFNLIKYEFDKIATELISQTNENLNYIVEFIHWIEYVNKEFHGFIVENSLKNNLNLVNSEGELIKASELFFGKEYGFDTTNEIISKVAPDKLLAAPEFYEIEDTIDDYIKIFELLGVSRFPRKKIAEFPFFEKTDYIDYSFGKNSIVEIYGRKYEINQEGIKSLTVKGTPYSIKIKVTTIEYLEEILQIVSFETIMKWIMEDRALRTYLSEKTEHNTSEISFYNNGYKAIPSTEMKPYVKYIFSKYPWIKGETGNKDIYQCCLSIKGMSPIVEKPVFQSEKYDAKNIRETERDFNNILIDLGVAENFSGLPANVVYQILLELPNNDPKGELTKTVYDQFIQSKIELADVKDCDKYKEFISRGKVFAIKNGNRDYCDIGEVYYSDNRIFSENLINRFNILNLQKRRGEDKVKDLLGVKPLKDINVRVTHYKLSVYNDTFKKYFKEFLPYVLALVKNSTSTSTIDKLTVQLVTEINAKFKSVEDYIEYEVGEKESVLVNDGGKYVAFVLINDGSYASAEKVYSDWAIADVIAEIITGVLKVEGNRTVYRELFTKDEYQRKTLLRRDFGDDIFEKIDSAKELLKIKSDAGNDFWYAMAMAMRLNISDNYKEAVEKQIDCEVYDFLHNGKWDFKNTINTQILSQLVLLFKTAKIDIKDYNEYSSSPISIKPLLDEERKNLLKKYTPFYYSFVYNQFVVNKSKSKREINELLRNFNFWDNDIADNSYKTDQEKQLLEFLNVQKDVLLSQEVIPQETVEASIKNLNDQPISSNDSAVSGDSQSEPAGMPEPSDSFAKIDIASILKSVEIEQFNEDELSGTPTDHTRSKPKKGHIGDAKRNHAEDVETGRLAEQIVFQKLKEKYGEHKVTWCSQYGNEAGEDSQGGDGYGYDLTYKDENGDTYYVEVKGSKNDNYIFRMSKNEKDTAEKYGDKYIIFFVFNLSKECNYKDIRIICNAGLFKYEDGESFFANSKFNVDNREFLISLKRQ